MSRNGRGRTVLLLMLLPVTVIAQAQRDVVPLTSWPAPLYWQPSDAEDKASRGRPEIFSNSAVSNLMTDDVTPQAQTPANSLVFVAMTPCRVVDTRNGSGFTGAFGPPSLVGGASRTFPIQSSPNCSIPSIAQAYSLNITLVSFSFVDFITVWPTGLPRPNASTLNGYVNTVIANAAIVPAGTNGSVDVYASQNTNIIIDINGYYASQSGITLAQGTVGAPSLSFVGDPGTGIFSSGPSTLDLATGGTSRIRVDSNGVQLPNGVQLAVGTQGNQVQFGSPNAETGMSISGTSGRADLRFDGTLKLVNGPGGIPPETNGIAINSAGNVGIGTVTPVTKLHVVSSGSAIAIYGKSTSGSGVHGESAVSSLTAAGVYGKGTGSGSIGVIGEANINNAVGVFGVSTSPGGVAVYARNTSGGRAIYAEGNAGQNLADNGFVKAMISVDQSSLGIVKCYNGITNSSSGNCGFILTYPLGLFAGVYRINFGFPVSNRFVSATCRYNYNCGANYREFDGTSIEFFTFNAGQTLDTFGQSFTMIMY